MTVKYHVNNKTFYIQISKMVSRIEGDPFAHNEINYFFLVWFLSQFYL